MTDQHLIGVYNQGWFDCADSTDNKNLYPTPLEQRAYQLGWDNYIIGDEVKSADSWTNKEIIRRIRK